MKDVFWKRLVNIYIQSHTLDVVKELEELRREVVDLDYPEVDKKRMLKILDDIINSDNVIFTLKNYTESEITRFIGGDLCQ